MATATITKIIPLISSDVAGPLGAIHLPRLWTKLTLSRAGLLAQGYDECGAGFDQMTIDALGLQRQQVMDYVKNQGPTYVQFEEWVRQNGKTDPETINRHNAAIKVYNHNDSLAADMRKASRVKDATIKDAVTLNKLEDLDELYAQVGG